MVDGVTISSTLHQGAAGRRGTSKAPPSRSAGRIGSKASSSAVTCGAGRSGFPTANLETPPHTAIPADGVYAGWLTSLDLNGRETGRWPAAISVGTNPTFGEGERTVEAYALDRDDLDLYGAHAAIDFAVRLRGNERFDTVDALVAQMREDVDQARVLTAT